MNHNKRVVSFTLAALGLLLAASILIEVSGRDFLKLHNISLIADVVQGNSAAPTDGPAGGELPAGPAGTPLRPSAANAFARYYSHPGFFVHFAADSALPALPRLSAGLRELRGGKTRKVRIAWLGDSIIEGDQMTKTVRRLLQEYFGGYGVGFVPVESAASRFRTTVRHSWAGNWREESFKTKEPGTPLFLSGHTFFTADGSVSLQDVSYKDSTLPLYKSLICGPAAAPVTVLVNGQPRTIQPAGLLNRVTLDSGAGQRIAVQVQDASLPVYGLSMESASGVVLDNFSFRGITGVELSKLAPEMLQAIAASDEYDLIVLEYGANLLFRPNDVNQDWYAGKMRPILKNLRAALPATDILLVSSGDRAFRYGDGFETARGLDTLVRTQAQLAYENSFSFFNLFASMGGRGTIVRWAEVENPPMANKDYIHPNLRGADWLAEVFYKAFVADAEKTAGRQAN